MKVTLSQCAYNNDLDCLFTIFCFIFQVHVNLMLLEARLQGELLYALRAVMQHMTWTNDQ